MTHIVSCHRVDTHSTTGRGRQRLQNNPSVLHSCKYSHMGVSGEVTERSFRYVGHIIAVEVQDPQGTQSYEGVSLHTPEFVE